jgi:hypothetical protein
MFLKQLLVLGFGGTYDRALCYQFDSTVIIDKKNNAGVQKNIFGLCAIFLFDLRAQSFNGQKLT